MWKDTNNSLSSDRINLLKAKGIIGSEVLFFEELTSTFDKINTLPPQNGLTVVCAKQTMGSGRFGRVWESAYGGVYFTFALTNPLEKFDIPFITIVCALGVCLALNKYAPCSIKWPNDIVCGGKKLCGILTRNLAVSENVNRVLVGIGINVNNSFPDSLPHAASLKSVSGYEHDENKLLFEVLDSIDKIYHEYSTNEILSSYRSFCVNLGKEVTLMHNAEELKGICKDILPDGSMLFDDGKKAFSVYSGEVSVKGIYS